MAYATTAQVKEHNQELALILSDTEIDFLIDNAESLIDRHYDKADGHYEDTDYFATLPPAVNGACIWLVGYLFRIIQDAGLDNRRLGDHSFKVESPELIRKRLDLMLSNITFQDYDISYLEEEV